MNDQRVPRINHSDCDHADTVHEKRKCREQKMREASVGKQVKHGDHQHPRTSNWYKKCRAHMIEHGTPLVVEGYDRAASDVDEWVDDVSTDMQRAGEEYVLAPLMRREAEASIALDGDTYSLPGEVTIGPPVSPRNGVPRIDLDELLSLTNRIERTIETIEEVNSVSVKAFRLDVNGFSVEYDTDGWTVTR
jgi:hypothetical protein